MPIVSLAAIPTEILTRHLTIAIRRGIGHALIRLISRPIIHVRVGRGLRLRIRGLILIVGPILWLLHSRMRLWQVLIVHLTHDRGNALLVVGRRGRVVEILVRGGRLH